MEVLLNNLQSSVLHRNVKPPILSCFGDIALAIGGSFEPFLVTAISVLQQAGAMRADAVCVFWPTALPGLKVVTDGLRYGRLHHFLA